MRVITQSVLWHAACPTARMAFCGRSHVRFYGRLSARLCVCFAAQRLMPCLASVGLTAIFPHALHGWTPQCMPGHPRTGGMPIAARRSTSSKGTTPWMRHLPPLPVHPLGIRLSKPLRALATKPRQARRVRAKACAAHAAAAAGWTPDNVRSAGARARSSREWAAVDGIGLADERACRLRP